MKNKTIINEKYRSRKKCQEENFAPKEIIISLGVSCSSENPNNGHDWGIFFFFSILEKKQQKNKKKNTYLRFELFMSRYMKSIEKVTDLSRKICVCASVWIGELIFSTFLSSQSLKQYRQQLYEQSVFF